MTDFSHHRGFSTMFREGRLTVGLFFAIESYSGAIPAMDIEQQIKTARLADEKGFASLFVRDVPLNDPSFGDVGQIYDPWVFLGFVAAATSKIALATGSIVAALRHPLHISKAAASVDALSRERLVLGLATGDRPIEFGAFQMPIEDRGERFREAVSVMRRTWADDFPRIRTQQVDLAGADTLPKPLLGNIPILVTGNARQSVEWIAAESDGWLYYPRNPAQQAETVRQWRAACDRFKPFSQSLYIDLAEDPNAPPTPIHLGFRSGRNFVIEFLGQLQHVGVNHVPINLKYGKRPAHEVVQELGEFVIPHFPAHTD